MHQDSTQRTRLTEWYKQLYRRIEEGDSYHLKRFIENRKLNLETSKTSTIKEWIRGILNMEKITEEYQHQDIRNWFQNR